MKITYSSKTIKSIVESDRFKTLVEAIEKRDGSLDKMPMTFIFSDFECFIDFVNKLNFLSRESRLDYIKEISIDMDEVLYMDEIIQS